MGRIHCAVPAVPQVLAMKPLPVRRVSWILVEGYPLVTGLASLKQNSPSRLLLKRLSSRSACKFPSSGGIMPAFRWESHNKTSRSMSKSHTIRFPYTVVAEQREELSSRRKASQCCRCTVLFIHCPVTGVVERLGGRGEAS